MRRAIKLTPPASPPAPLLLQVLLIVLYFLPETSRENKRMQTKRAMLLYLPIFVVSKIRSIRELIRDIVSAEAGVSAASVARPEGRGQER